MAKFKKTMLDAWITKRVATLATATDSRSTSATPSSKTSRSDDIWSPSLPSDSSTMQTIGWTAINQPWKRTEHNSKLFYDPPPDGPRLRPHLTSILPLPGPTPSPLEADSEETEQSASGTDQAQDGTTEQSPDEEQKEDDSDLEQIRAECDEIFKADTKLLRNERLLKVAAHFTNNEIAENVNLCHPDTSLTTLRITQWLTDSLTKVAKNRGVERDVLKRQLDDDRKKNGVLDRQMVYNNEMRRKAKEARKGDRDPGEDDERPRKVLKQGNDGDSERHVYQEPQEAETAASDRRVIRTAQNAQEPERVIQDSQSEGSDEETEDDEL